MGMEAVAVVEAVTAVEAMEVATAVETVVVEVVEVVAVGAVAVASLYVQTTHFQLSPPHTNFMLSFLEPMPRYNSKCLLRHNSSSG
jgi:hypothetical protein